jgi:hypothetical protein
MMGRDEIRKLTADKLDDAIREALEALSDRQRVFCEQVVQGMSQTEAAKLAGYNPKWASGNITQISRNKGVALALELLREGASRGAAVTAEWVRSQLKQNIRDAREAGDLGVVTQCLRELSKLDDHYSPEKHHHMGNPWGELLDQIPSTIGPPRHRDPEPSRVRH